MTCSSRHFSHAELVDHHDGTCDMSPTFLALLDDLRDQYGKPIVLWDAYRSEATQRIVNPSVRHSMHPLGLAADPRTVLNLRWVEGLHLFSGIGYGRHTGRVTHIDARHLAGAKNLTGGTPRRPTLFVDGN